MSYSLITHPSTNKVMASDRHALLNGPWALLKINRNDLPCQAFDATGELPPPAPPPRKSGVHAARCDSRPAPPLAVLM